MTQGLTGLVLTGGGARTAYQVGVMCRVGELAKSMGQNNPFPIITGTSAGAINASYLAAHSENITDSSKNLCAMWRSLTSKNIYKVDISSLLLMLGKGVGNLFMGGLLKRESASNSLLDNTPLRKLIHKNMVRHKIQRAIKNGHLYGFGIKTTNYSTGMSETFFQGHPSIQEWHRHGRRGYRRLITPEHVIASAAIPMLFPPSKIGPHYYGDGSLRNYTPLSPAIKMGASKLFIVGVRRHNQREYQSVIHYPSSARILSLTLNSVLLDALDVDHERLSRINNTLKSLDPNKKSTLKPIDVFMIRPSADIGKIAMLHANLIHRNIRYLLHGLGSSLEGSDLISYLLFEPPFISTLIDLGYEDARRQDDEIKAFLAKK